MPITIENLSFTYTPGTPFETVALRDISFSVADGEYVGIMGHTGCGKSTLIQLLTGLMKPTSGKILMDGKNINDSDYNRDELRRKVGIVFQYPEYQLFETTVEKDVAFGLKHSNFTKKEAAENIRWALTILGFDFERVRKRSPLSFSGGEKRKIAIAGILAVKPKVLILDEPIAGLDPYGREEFLHLTKELNDAGTTIIMVSHNIDALAEYASRIIVLEDGEITVDNEAKVVFADEKMLADKGIGITRVGKIKNALQSRGVHIPEQVTRYEELLPFLTALGKGDLQ